MKSNYRWIVAVALVVLIGASSVLLKPSAKIRVTAPVHTVLTVTTTMPIQAARFRRAMPVARRNVTTAESQSMTGSGTIHVNTKLRTGPTPGTDPRML